MVQTRSTSRAIVRDRQIQGGEPIVRGTRVPVRSIVLAFDRHGDIIRVSQSFELTPEQVEAALAFYQRHRTEINRIIDENERAAGA